MFKNDRIELIYLGIFNIFTIFWFYKKYNISKPQIIHTNVVEHWLR